MWDECDRLRVHPLSCVHPQPVFSSTAVVTRKVTMCWLALWRPSYPLASTRHCNMPHHLGSSFLSLCYSGMSIYIYITRVIHLIFILLGLVHVCTRKVIISLSYFGCGYQILLHSHPLVSIVVPMLLYHMWPSCYPSRWHHSPCLATGWPSTTWCPRAALSARPTTSWRWCWNTWAPPVSCDTPRQTNMSHLQTHSQAESATSLKEHYFLTWCKQSELF